MFLLKIKTKIKCQYILFYIILANKSGVLSGMPPGVTPLVGAQYILSQQGIPGYYHQSHPVMYSDEHLQMVQSRLPHHMVKIHN